MKKIVFTLIFALVGISSAFAQFEKGKYYLAATTNSGGFSYSKAHKARFNLGVNGGYMFEEAWMGIAEVGFDYHNRTRRRRPSSTHKATTSATLPTCSSTAHWPTASSSIAT